MPPEVLGPLGLTAAAVLAVIVLWRDHLRSDLDDRQQRDEAFNIARDAIDGTKRMAAAWEARNRRDERRSRPDDS